MFTHLGFPDYFRVELSWATVLGVVLLLAPVPGRLKEWAYAGFAITLASALEELGDWRGKTLAKVRDIIRKADPEIVEEWKWRKASSPACG